MFKRILAITVMTALFATNVFAAEAGEDSGAAFTPSVQLTSVRQIIEMDRTDERTFDNITDQIYFNQFGQGFEIMQRNSSDINRTITQGNWQLEILSTLAIPGHTFSSLTWPEYIDFTFDEETGEFGIVNTVTGEAVSLEELEAMQEEVKLTDVEIITFFSLRDTTGRVDLSTGIEITLAGGDRGAMRTGGIFMAHPRLLHIDANSAYFSASHRAQVENIGDSISFDFGISRILADRYDFTREVEIDLADLIASHEATFVVEGYPGEHYGWVPSRGGGTDMRIHDILGQDFDPLSFDNEIMTRGELSVSIGGGIYLSNIATRGGLLLLQMSEDNVQYWPRERWAHFGLIDTRHDPVDWDELTEVLEEITDPYERMELLMTIPNRYPHSLYSIDVTPLDRDFMTVGSRRYTEHAFHFEDLEEVIGHIAFNLFGGYYRANVQANLSAPIESPIIGQSLQIDTTADVEIYGRTYTVRGFEISPLEISFTIENAQPLIDRMNDRDWTDNWMTMRWFTLDDHIDVVLIHADGTESEFAGFLSGWGHSWGSPDDDRESVLSDLRVSFGGIVLDIDDLVGVRVNGVKIEK